MSKSQALDTFNCESCGASTYGSKDENHCKGCGIHVCDACVLIFDHWGDGEHGSGDPGYRLTRNTKIVQAAFRDFHAGCLSPDSDTYRALVEVGMVEDPE